MTGSVIWMFYQPGYKILNRKLNYNVLYCYYLHSLIRYCFKPMSSPKLLSGQVNLHTRHFGNSLKKSSMTSKEYKKIVLEAKNHIIAGDIFQIVLSQRFECRTFADPFEVYRALRVVNPSPYMCYLQVQKQLISFNFFLKKLNSSSRCSRLGDVFLLAQVLKFLPV